MRALMLMTMVLLPAAAAAQADPLPLHPGVPGVRVDQDNRGRWVIMGVVPGSPADAAGLGRGGQPDLVAVDGRPVKAMSEHQMRTALAGPIGSTVEVTVCESGKRRTVRVGRADLMSPIPGGYPGVVESRRFVVHHRPTPEDAREARALAADAERKYERTGLPRDTRGRRAHLWLSSTTYGMHRESWVATARYEPNGSGSLERVFGYLAFGDPGLAARDFDHVAITAQAGPPRWSHQAAARRILENRRAAAIPGAEPAMVSPMWRSGHRSMQYGWGSHEAASLRTYIVERFGAERFERLWTSNDDLSVAVPRALGIPMGTLLRDWGAYVVDLGPDPEVRVDRGSAAMALGWGALALLWSVRLARRREVG